MRQTKKTTAPAVVGSIGREQPPLSQEDKNICDMALAVLDPFFQIRGTMPAQYIKAFLLVAREPGLSVTEYSERAGVSLSVMSRHLLDIGDRNRYREAGFGLVTSRTNPMELRRHEFFLTPKGKALFHQIKRAVERV